MQYSRLKLRTLRLQDEISFRLGVAAFAMEEEPFDFAFEFKQPVDFAAYIQKLDGWTRGENLPDKFVTNTFFVGVVDGVVVGRLSLRHELNDWLNRIGGHIGYGVVPMYRKMGYAKQMLRQVLPICSGMGLSRVLVTCDVSNIESRKVIEGCGGVFESVTNEPELEVQKRRYWIDTP